MNYIVTRNQEFFKNIGQYNYCSLEEMGKMLTPGLAFDSETTGLSFLDNVIFAVQLGTGEDNFLIDLQDYSKTPRFKNSVGVTQTVDEVWPLIEGKHLVFHNAMFDLGFILKAGFVPKVDHVWDSLIASRILHNGNIMMRHNFGEMMLRELDVKYNKDEQKNIHRVKLSTPSAIDYCFNDVDRLKEVHKLLYKKLSTYGANKTYDLNRQVLLPLVYMESCGIPINLDKWRAKMDSDQTEMSTRERDVVEYIWDKLPEYRTGQINLFDNSKKVKCLLSSPKQMIEVFKKLGINVETDDKKTGGTKDSIDETVISLDKHEFVPIWLAFKNAQHKVSNFGANILKKVRPDGRLYVKFNPMVDTSRISAKKEGAMNSLNIPADSETRDCFEAKDGYRIIVCDYTGQETIVLADKSQDTTMVMSVIEGLDLHCAFARLAFPEIASLDDETIKKEHKNKRDFVKSPRFAFSYGGSAYTVAKNSGMSMEEAQFLEDKFKELHEGVYEWGNKVLEEALAVGYIESVDGWRLYLPNFSEYKSLGRQIQGITKEMWQQYRSGKMQHKAEREAGEKGLEYEIIDQDGYDIYEEWRGPVRKYFKARGEYFRLCLNNPIQTTGAHQTKLALVKLFQYVVERSHLWQVRFVNSPYDEIVLEVKEELCEEYKEVLGRIMREAGNHYLYSGLVKIEADANVGDSWYKAK